MSVFLNLASHDILVEYIYSNEISDTIDSNFKLIEDSRDNSKYLFNTQSSILNDNNIDRSVYKDVDMKFYSLTNKKLGLPYNDYNDYLTNSDSYDLSFGVTEGVKYDTIRVHFINGFTFNDVQKGVYLNVGVNDRNENRVNLLSINYTFEDNYIQLNSTPFIYATRQYSTFIEFKVVSLQYLKESFITEYQQQSNSDILSYKISNGVGFKLNSNIIINAGIFGLPIKSNNQIVSKLISVEGTIITSKERFDEIGINIQESNKGDYIEFYGVYNDVIFGDYINDLNNNGENFIVLYDLILFEQLPNTVIDYNLVSVYNPLTNIPQLDTSYINSFQNGDYWVVSENTFSTYFNTDLVKGDFIVFDNTHPNNLRVQTSTDFDEIAQFVKTSELSFIQDSDFNVEQKFRPVLKFSGSALSYKISLVMKILNTNTNSIIEKRAEFFSFDTHKYGNKLVKIDTNANFSNYNVFNKIVKNVIERPKIDSNMSITNSSLYTKNITSFHDRYNIQLTNENVLVDQDNKLVSSQSTNNKTLFGQNESTIYITPFDDYILFSIFDVKDEVNNLDLTKIGKLYLCIKTTNSILRIEEESSQSIDKTKGDVMFKIKQSHYELIYDTNSYFITTKDSNGSETMLYQGMYKNIDNKKQDDNFIKIVNLNNDIATLSNSVNLYKEYITELENQVKELGGIIPSKVIEDAVKTKVNEELKVNRLNTKDNGANNNAESIKNSNFNNFK